MVKAHFDYGLAGLLVVAFDNAAQLQAYLEGKKEEVERLKNCDDCTEKDRDLERLSFEVAKLEEKLTQAQAGGKPQHQASQATGGNNPSNAPEPDAPDAQSLTDAQPGQPATRKRLGHRLDRGGDNSGRITHRTAATSAPVVQRKHSHGP